ncbi:MAG: 5'/3'-nucleotidase SurE [Nitrospinota bacterium]|nr:5'/3'-nucleotidase SurE [Nitrospinota bacterium]
MILLTNDDGFNAPGLRALRKEIAAVSDVMIVAPETEQSAVGHVITIASPLRIRKVVEGNEFLGYALNGTPADCVKIAITDLLNQSPCLVISGINHGGNLGTCILYSGTVSAATEAAIMGIPAIAVSLNNFSGQDFSPAACFARKLALKVVEKGLPEGVSLNVNVPPVPAEKIKGVAVTRQGKSRVIETFEKRTDPRDNTYYWMAGEMVFNEVEKETDFEMISKNYISITPIHYDLTHFKTLEQLKDWDIKL